MSSLGPFGLRLSEKDYDARFGDGAFQRRIDRHLSASKVWVVISAIAALAFVWIIVSALLPH